MNLVPSERNLNHSFLDTTYFEIIVCAVIYQLALYICIRLAHRGFTVGELGLVCFGGIALTMEMLNLTKTQVLILLTFGSTLPNICTDLASYDSIHQNLSSTNTIASSTSSSSCGIVSSGFHVVATPMALAPYCPTASSSTPLASGKATVSAWSRCRVLCWLCPYNWGSNRHVGEMVSRQARSMAMGYFLDTGGKKQVESAPFVSLLGIAGEFECRRLESTTGEVKTV